MKTIALIVGTRPEIIKMSPVYCALKNSTDFKPLLIFSGQHESMAEQALSAFALKPDCSLELMKENQSPNSFLAELLPALEQQLLKLKPDMVLVQGDTSTALGGALAAFHLQIPVAHVEAGLRTYNMASPFPEEMNRTAISRLASIHFAPTERAKKNLAREGIEKNVYLTGNTVVDALLQMNASIQSGVVAIDKNVLALLTKIKRFLLVTGHRRENFDRPLKNLSQVILNLVNKIPDLDVIYPVHLNPNVRAVIQKELCGQKRIHLIEPTDYPTLLHLIDKCALIITDSGGIQEEAPSLAKHTLVSRAFTERSEAIEAGCAELFPLDKPEALFERAYRELENPSDFPAITGNPFGDGKAAERIVEILKSSLN